MTPIEESPPFLEKLGLSIVREIERLINSNDEADKNRLNRLKQIYELSERDLQILLKNCSNANCSLSSS